MKEAFEKIKERLEEEVKYQNEEADLAPPFCELTFEEARRKMGECYERAIEIVNQVAEEYDNDFCAWKHAGFGGEWNTSCKKSKVFVPYGVAFFKFCPCCGKKIKVVE